MTQNQRKRPRKALQERQNCIIWNLNSSLLFWSTKMRLTNQQCAEKDGNKIQQDKQRILPAFCLLALQLIRASFGNNGSRKRKWPTAMTSAETENTLTASVTKVTSSAGCFCSHESKRGKWVTFWWRLKSQLSGSKGSRTMNQILDVFWCNYQL